MAQTPEQRREYQRQWKAKKLAEDPDYFNRYDREYRKAHPDATREKQRRSYIAGRERQKQWVAKNRDHVREYHRRYREEHRAQMRQYSYDAYQRQQEKWKRTKREQYAKDPSPAKRRFAKVRNTKKGFARMAVYYAVRNGWLAKPDACSECGAMPERRQIQAHHDDYDKPFDVVWLCAACHGKRHRLT